MPIEVFNRYEKKYMINIDEYHMMVDALSGHMKKDKYNKEKEFYTICNIYFDTPDDRLIRRSIEKPVYKEKLRLRSYGVPEASSRVFLEIKKKYKGIVNKRRIRLQLCDAYDFVESGKIPEINEKTNIQVLKELEYFINVYENLMPKVYIAYDRMAFFGIEEPELRVTFDTNIRTRRENVRLEAGDYGESILPDNIMLMEIKTINSMPLWLADILNSNGIRNNSFSKYGTEYTNKIKGELELC